MPSLCGSAEATRKWFRAFAAHSFLACRPLRPRGVRHRYPERDRLSKQGRIDRAAAHALVAQHATIDAGDQHLGRREHLRARDLELPALLDGLCRARADRQRRGRAALGIAAERAVDVTQLQARGQRVGGRWPANPARKCGPR